MSKLPRKNRIIDPDRLFSPEPAHRKLARQLFARVAALPLICPHGHVDPRLFSTPDYSFGSPVDLLIIPDHYVFRMLYSQGIPLEELGIPRKNGATVETDHKKIWRIFADNFYLFRGTPSGVWLSHEFHSVFGIRRKLTGETAQVIYDRIAHCLKAEAYRPRALFEKFNIEVLCTTDAATDSLEHHLKIRESGWKGRILPTFRPDGVVNIDDPNWKSNIAVLSACTGTAVENCATLIQALEKRRLFFRRNGAVSTDHGCRYPYTGSLSVPEADSIMQRAFKGTASAEDAMRFTGHMLIENARMSIDDGLVMQLHVGVHRNHNKTLYDSFGPDKGCDIPIATEFVSNLRPLLDAYGSDPRLTLVLFSMDESSYSRELAPLAGHYPALRLGPPWWFQDSPNGMTRYFDLMMESAGLYNTAGFNDDTRAFPSIPARHDVWRRSACNWIAGLVVRGIIDRDDAQAMAYDAAYGLAKKVYKLG